MVAHRDIELVWHLIGFGHTATLPNVEASLENRWADTGGLSREVWPAEATIHSTVPHPTARSDAALALRPGLGRKPVRRTAIDASSSAQSHNDREGGEFETPKGESSWLRCPRAKSCPFSADHQTFRERGQLDVDA